VGAAVDAGSGAVNGVAPDAALAVDGAAPDTSRADEGARDAGAVMTAQERGRTDQS